MNGIGTRVIETKRLILRPMKIDDAEEMYINWTSDPNTTKYLSWESHHSLKETIDYVNSQLPLYEKEYYFNWVIELKQTGELIGNINAEKVSLLHRLCEMNDCIGPRFWNKGYATEALKAFIEYMFKKVGFEKIIARHLATNPASGRVMLKAGMKCDGILKGWAVDKTTGLRTDMVCYSIDNPTSN